MLIRHVVECKLTFSYFHINYTHDKTTSVKYYVTNLVYFILIWASHKRETFLNRYSIVTTDNVQLNNLMVKVNY